MKCNQKPYCARERGHDGVCLDGAALTAVNLTAERDEAQSIARQSMQRFDELHAILMETKAERDAARAEVERLREALRGLLVRVDDGADYGEGHAVAIARAALAGAPSETRREQDRALAERVREACVTALAESDGDPRSLRALNLDALLSGESAPAPSTPVQREGR